MRNLLLSLVALTLVAAGQSHAATLTLTNQSANSTFFAVAPEQDYFDYDHRYASLNQTGAPAVDVQTSTFWTDANQFWLFGADNKGVLHTIDLNPMPTLVNVTLHQIVNGQQRSTYQYFFGQTTNGVIAEQWLPVVTRTLAPAGVPEPSTLALAALGLVGAAFRRLQQ
jgi:hypothetical protein